MATSDKSQSHIQQILNTFHHFILLYEKDAWLKTTTTENIISAFKCASFIEETVKHAKKNNTGDDLVSALNSWWEEVKERTKVYEFGFYEFACDRLLEKFFVSNLSSGDCTDVAVRIYTKMTSKERLEKVLKEVMLKSSSFEAIIEHVIENKNACLFDEYNDINLKGGLSEQNKNTGMSLSQKNKKIGMSLSQKNKNTGMSVSQKTKKTGMDLSERIKISLGRNKSNTNLELKENAKKLTSNIDTKSDINLGLNLIETEYDQNLEVQIFYNNWLDEYSKGNKVLIENHIDSMLTCYKLEKSLFVLISILSFDNVFLQSVIIKKLEPKMLDRSSLSKKFWTGLFKGVKIQCVIEACVSNKRFLNLFFDFVEYLVTMVNWNSENEAWVVDSNVDCVEVTCYELFVVIRAFYDKQELRSYVVKRIKDAKDNIGTPVWEDFEKKLILCE